MSKKKKLKEELGYIKQGDPKNKSEEQQNTIDKIENIFNSRQEVVKMFNHYARTCLEIFMIQNKKEQGLKY